MSTGLDVDDFNSAERTSISYDFRLDIESVSSIY